MERIFLFVFFAFFIILIICISCTSAQDGSLVPRTLSDVSVYPERRYADVIHIFPPKKPKRRRRRSRRCLRRRPRPYYDRIDTNANRMMYTDSLDGQYEKHFTIIPLIESAKTIEGGTKFIPIAIIKHDPWYDGARSNQGSALPNHYVNLKPGKSSAFKTSGNPQFSYNVKFQEFPKFQENSWDMVRVPHDQSAILKKVRKYAQPGWGEHFMAQEPVPGQILYPPISPQYLPIPLLEGPKRYVQQGGFRGTNQDRWLVPSGDRVKDFYERDIPRTPSSNAIHGEFYEDQIHKNHRHYLARNSTMTTESIKPVYEDVDEGKHASYRATPFLTKSIVFVTPRSVNSTKDKDVKIVSKQMGTNYSSTQTIYGKAIKRMGDTTLAPIPTKVLPARWAPVNMHTTIGPPIQQSDRYSIVDIKPNISLPIHPKRNFTKAASSKLRMDRKDGNRKL